MTMKTIIVSAFDNKFMDYAERMYKSFSFFHPNIPMYCCKFDLSNPEKERLQKIGVTCLDRTQSYEIKDGRCFDLALWDFLKNLDFDQMLWTDADTMFVSPVTEIFSLKYDFIGHPGRNKNGLVFRPLDVAFYNGIHKYGKYYATGLWVANTKQILIEFQKFIMQNPQTTFDSIPATDIVNEKFTHYQLDGNLYNFSRDVVCRAKFENGKIHYEENCKIHFPKTVGFSTLDNKTRAHSLEVDKFYEEVIEKAWKKV